MAAIEDYLLSIYSTATFFRSSADHQRTRVLRRDTLKCMVLGATMLVVWNFGKGKTHYLKYLWKAALGCTFGLTYSFYFTARKVEQWRIDDLHTSLAAAPTR